MASTGTKLSPVLNDLTHRLSGLGAIAPLSVGNDLVTRRAVVVLIDLLSIWAAGLIAIAVRFPLRAQWLEGAHTAFLLLYSGLVLLCCNTKGLYSGVPFPSFRDEMVAVTQAMAMASILLTMFIYASGLKVISRLVVTLTMVLGLVAISGFRYWRRRMLQRASVDGFMCRNVLIVGTGAAAQALHRFLERHRHLGYVAVGFLDADDEEVYVSNNVLGSTRNLGEIARAHFVDEIIICTDNRAAAKFAISESRACRLGARVIPDLYDGLACGAPVEFARSISDLPAA